MPKPDGGPAFPKPDTTFNGNYEYGPFGMSLRQWYAGQALVGMAANGPFFHSAIERGTLAKAAFEVADAMIAESENILKEEPNAV
jgi:hypothetical protein